MFLVEKYRPREFRDVIGLPVDIESMMSDIPHFLFIGKPGTGKTTTAKIIINKVGGDSLLMNASDENSIDDIREKVITFAMTQSSSDKIKIVFLDEADRLSKPAMDSLRNVMEKYHKNCRFILTGNYENKFTDAIFSRCSGGIVRFTNQNDDAINRRLRFISDSENIKISEELIKKIVEKCKGDFRIAINQLQRLSYLNREITEKDVYESLNLSPEIHALLLKGDFITARQKLLDSNIEYDVFLDEYHDFLVDAYIVKKTITANQFNNVINALANAVIYINSVISKEIIVENFLIKAIVGLKQ